MNDDKRGLGEVLAAVAANVAAAPLVLGFVALGGVVLAGRVVLDVTGQALGARNGRRPVRKRRARKVHAPAAKATPPNDPTA